MSDLLIGFEEFLEKHKAELPKKILNNKNKSALFLIYAGGFADGKKEAEGINKQWKDKSHNE